MVLAMFIVLCSSPGILRQPPLLAREGETFWYLFCPCAPYGSQVGEEAEEEEKKDDLHRRIQGGAQVPVN